MAPETYTILKRKQQQNPHVRCLGKWDTDLAKYYIPNSAILKQIQFADFNINNSKHWLSKGDVFVHPSFITGIYNVKRMRHEAKEKYSFKIN